MDSMGRLQLAKDLVQHLEVGDDSGADAVIERMTRERESSLFMEIGRLTRELHDSLMSVKLDNRITGLAEHDIPDAKQRLHYVIQKTEDAAHRTLNAVETLMPITDRIGQKAARITGDWSRFTRREMDVGEFKSLCGEVGRFLEEVRTDSSQIQANLSDVLMAQDFQDLTGQVIRRIIDLVTEVENNLVRLIRCSGGKAGDQEPQHDPVRAEGPRVEGTKSNGQHVNGQDDVDALLSSLGF